MLKNKVWTLNSKFNLIWIFKFLSKLFKISGRIYFLEINFEKFENVLENYFKKFEEYFENLE